MNKGFLLIVEDKLELRELLCDIFTPEVAMIEFAKNGEEALYKMENNPYINCVLTEIKLPKLTGIEFLKITREVRKDLTPFIFLTAYGRKDYVQDALKYGAYDFVEKPFKVDNLIETVQQAIAVNLRTRGKENFNDLISKENVLSRQYAQILKDKKLA